MEGEPQAGRPDWDRLYQAASEQEGLFTTQQAAGAGYSRALLAHHSRAGKVRHVRRGVYRLVHFPLSEHDDLVVAWLWSEHEGVLSHLTALALHRLSDVLPAQVHLTLPAAWRQRRFRVPEDLVLHHGDVPAADRAWFGPVPITTPRRTLIDCAHDDLTPELLSQAAQQAVHRGIVARDELDEVAARLAPYGGIPA